MTVVVLTLAALATSVVSALASVQAAQEAQRSNADAKTSIDLARQGLEASLEETRLQGAVPVLVGNTDVVEHEGPHLGRTAHLVTGSMDEVGIRTISEIAVVNEGLMATDVMVGMIDPKITRNVSPGEFLPLSFDERNCTSQVTNPIRVEPQVTTKVSVSFYCENSLPDYAPITLRFGNGDSINALISLWSVNWDYNPEDVGGWDEVVSED
ncbi:hypothetical protein [Kineococcus sp. SYSU DK006]|uniref:hypothetical protein n=1 Tax=Kineococcus sp. SYSU DK006 TaxID=3383127 RepID=UPI003D7E3AD2